MAESLSDGIKCVVDPNGTTTLVLPADATLRLGEILFATAARNAERDFGKFAKHLDDIMVGAGAYLGD